MVTDDTNTAQRWIARIQKEEKAHGNWRKEAKAAEDSYFDDCKPKHLFNLFYSTVNTLHARLYSKAPNPDVRRRFDAQGEEGKAAKQAALLVERGLAH